MEKLKDLCIAVMFSSSRPLFSFDSFYSRFWLLCFAEMNDDDDDNVANLGTAGPTEGQGIQVRGGVIESLSHFFRLIFFFAGDIRPLVFDRRVEEDNCSLIHLENVAEENAGKGEQETALYLFFL